MHKFVIFLFVITVFCSNQKNVADNNTAATRNAEKTLIVYLSRTNNTKAIAEIIHQELGGDLVALELENPYPADYDSIVQQVQLENERNFLPPLKTKVDLTKYDTIFLGFPTWGMRLPPPMKSFLARNDLSEKTVIPFNTNAGYGVGSGFEKVTELCPNSIILKGFSTKGGIERDGVFLAIKGNKREQTKKEIKQWLTEIAIK